MGPSFKLSRNGRIVGEFDLDTLRLMKAEGRILENDYLWSNGWADWQKAGVYLESQEVEKIPGGRWGQAVPIRSLNQNWRLLVGFWFSTPRVRPDPMFGSAAMMDDYRKREAAGSLDTGSGKIGAGGY